MKRRITLAALGAVLCFVPLQGTAQEKMKYHFSGKPEYSKYGQQHSIDVGDVPGHQLRVADLITKYGADAPVYAGVKVLGSRSVFTSDYTDGNGRFQSHIVMDMANGDRMYQRSEGLTHTVGAADGTRKTSFSTVTTITGGTGKFTAVRGILRTTAFTDLKLGISGTVTEGEYWFEK